MDSSTISEHLRVIIILLFMWRVFKPSKVYTFIHSGGNLSWMMKKCCFSYIIVSLNDARKTKKIKQSVQDVSIKVVDGKLRVPTAILIYKA